MIADLIKPCLLKSRVYSTLLSNDKSNIVFIDIQTNKLLDNDINKINCSSKVKITKKNKLLKDNNMQLQLLKNQSSHAVTANNNLITLTGKKIWSNLKTKDIDIYQGTYQLIGQLGRGYANMIKQRGNHRYTILDCGNFTLCLPGDDSWTISGKKLIYDHKEQKMKIWQSRFNIKNVPIFYSSYLQLPVGNKRYSGFLTPEIKYSSKTGIEINIPYYINIAPHYDMTITPNYMSKLGTQLKNEFRYLTSLGHGFMELNWLPNSLANSALKKNNFWQFYWHHSSMISKLLRLNIDYTKISNCYFNYLDWSNFSKIDSYTTQNIHLSYTNRNWDIAFFYKNFQIFDNSFKDAYHTIPQLNINFYKNNIDHFNFKVISQAVQFININDYFPQAIRLHLEPTIDLIFANKWGSLKTEAKIMATHYRQTNYYQYNQCTKYNLKKIVNRIIPQFKTEGKLIFNRKITYNSNYTQILETRFQYFYVPYYNQNNIGIYDSNILIPNNSELFYDSSYSGLDRIISAARLSNSIITRIYDHNNIEIFNLSAGQIYYFSRPYTNNIWNQYKDIGGGRLLLGNSYFMIKNKWSISGKVQYDYRLKSITQSDILLDYKYDNNYMLQLNYRYVNYKYFQPLLFHVNNKYNISQLGITGKWLLVNNWLLIGAYHYDMHTHQLLDHLISLQYNTCCWSLSVGYENKLNKFNSNNNIIKYDKKISLIFALRNLNSNLFSIN